MDEELPDQRFRRRKSGGRRSSSILKMKTPLLDLDPNQPINEVVIPRKKARISSSRRVSFAETYQVKEFPRDSPHRWMPDPEAEDDASPELENLPDVPVHSSRTVIQGLDKLLTGPIQSSPEEQQDGEELPLPDENNPGVMCGPNHTILQDENMDITDCLQKSVMIENLDQPLNDDFGDNFGQPFATKKLDEKSFLASFKKSSPESISDGLFLPEMKFSKNDNKNHYNLDKESDFMTMVNTSINKYNILNASQTTIAGGNLTSVTTSASQRRPLTSIDQSKVFKPVVVEQCNTIDMADNLIGTIDGSSFLKKLNFKSSNFLSSVDDRFDNQTIMFDGNDMEETEVITKCIQDNDEDESLIPSSVKVPGFLNSFKFGKKEEDHTVFFGRDNDMEDTEVIKNEINVFSKNAQTNEKTVILNNDMEQTMPLTTAITKSHLENLTGNRTKFIEMSIPDMGLRRKSSLSGLKDKENSRLSLLDNASKINQSIKNIAGIIGDDVEDKTCFFEKGDDMDETDVLTGKFELMKSLKSLQSTEYSKKELFQEGIVDETGLLSGKNDLVQSSKLLESNKTLMINDDMEETNVLGQKLGCLKSRRSIGINENRNKTLMFQDENDMEQTAAFTNKIELPVLSKSILGIQKEAEIPDDWAKNKETISQKNELPSLIKSSVRNKTLFFEENEMEESRALTGKLDFLSKTSKENEVEGQMEMNQTKGLINNSVFDKPQGDKTQLFVESNDMEETRALTTKIENISCIKENRTTIYKDGNEMEETCTYTSKVEYTSCRKIESESKSKEGEHENMKSTTDIQGNKTIQYKDDEMEQTRAITGKLELGIVPPGNETGQVCKDEVKRDQDASTEVKMPILSKDEDLEQTDAKTSNDEIFDKTSLGINNKTMQFTNDEMEETNAFTGKLELDSNKTGNKTIQFKNDEMEQTNAFTGKLELGSNVMGNKTIQFKNDEMEQTNAFTGKLELGSSVTENKMIEFKNDEMEQTNAFTGKLELGSNVMGNKTIQFKNDEMEQTNALTGKLELGSSVTENKMIEFKNDEMEQTNAFTGKLELYSNKTGNKTIQFKNGEMEQTNAFTGKLELGSTVTENKTIQFKNDEMEQTNAFSGKLELDSNKTGNKTIQFKNDEMEQTNAFTGKLELGSNVTENKTIQFKNEEMEQTNVNTGKLEMDPKETESKLMQFKNNEMKHIDTVENKVDAHFENKVDVPFSTISDDKTQQFNNEEIDQTNALTGKIELWEKDFTGSVKQLNENDIVKNKYRRNRALIQKIQKYHQDEIDIANDSMTGSGESLPDIVGKSEDTQNKGTEIRRGMSSLIAKMRQDMVGDDGNEMTENFEITENNFDKFLPVEKGEEDMNSEKPKDHTINKKRSLENENLNEFMERVDKNPRRSLGLQTMTPMGKLFGTAREAVTELKPHGKGSTIKLSDRGAATEQKVTKDQDKHHALLCSKELFSKTDDVKISPLQDEIKSSPLMELGSCMDVTLGNKSVHDGSGKADEFLTELDSHGGNISDEHLPAEMLTNSTMTSVQPDSTINSLCPEVNITTSSGAQSIIESRVEDFMKESMVEDIEGPMTVHTFFRKIQNQMPLPFWLREDGKVVNCRGSLALLPRVDKSTIKGQLEAKYVHKHYCDVYGGIKEEMENKLESCKEKIAEVSEEIKQHPPALFDIAVNGSTELKNETIENLKALVKRCKNTDERNLKEMKVQYHEKYYEKIKENRESLSEKVNHVVQTSDTIQQQLSTLSNVNSEMDSLISELEQKPLPSSEDVEFWRTSQNEIQQKEQELDSIRISKQELEREKTALEKEMFELQKEDSTTIEEQKVDENSSLETEIQELEEKLNTVESLIEWCIEDYEDDFMAFSFYNDSMLLSLNRQKDPDNGQIKITSAHVQSKLDTHATPTDRLVHSVILKRIQDVSLLQSYSNISELPQLLQNLSQITLMARNLKRQINSLKLKYLVTVSEDVVKVEKWSVKTLQKVDLTFTMKLEDTSVCVLPNVSIAMGNIRSEDVLEQLNTVTKGQEYLIKLCEAVDLDFLSNVTKIS